MNNDKFLIDANCLYMSQQGCCRIIDAGKRSQAVANVFAAEIAQKYFQDQSVDIKSGIHNVNEVLSDIDIADIYVNGNYIDVRVYFDENERYVPKVHFDYNILPVAYMFIKLDTELSTGEVTGFVFPENIDTAECKDGYYIINDDMIVSYYDVDSRFISFTDEGYETDFEKDAYDFIDGKLIEKEKFYQTLLLSQSAREFLQLISKSKSVFGSFDFISIAKDSETKTEEPYSTALDTDNTALIETEEFEKPQDLLEQVEPDNDILLENESYDELKISDDESPVLDETEGSLNNNNFEEIEPLSEYDSDTTETVIENDNPANIEEYEPIELAEETIDKAVDEELSDPAENMILEDNSVNDTEQQVPEDINSAVVEPVSSEEDTKDDITELSEFDYSTEIMPSINNIEGTDNSDNEVAVEVTEEMLDSTDSAVSVNTNYGVGNSQVSENQQIDKLFTKDSPKVVNTSKKMSPIIPLLGIIILIGAGYYGYTKYMESVPTPNSLNESIDIEQADKSISPETKQDAMPIETVENIETTKPTEEAASVSIPAIEQNLNASIQVSNLNINWEVPTGYANNATAKRYFLKVGKVLQLNLKAELLMLSKSPITNKISIELEFNKDTNKFTIKKFINSSGVTMVDNVVKDTVNKVLGMNMNMNMGVFNNLPGNPVLVINL